MLMSLLGLWLVGLSSGCNLLAPFYFVAILSGKDARVAPVFEFPPDAQRLLVVTYMPVGTQIEVGHFDQELDEAVARRLFEGFEADGKEIQVIKASRLAKWQDENPDWRSMEPDEIGRALKADYVVYLELDHLRFYGEGSNKTLYEGNVEVSISVVRVNEDDGEIVLPKDTLTVEFPRGRPMATDMPISRFRREFIRRLTEQICWYFLPHETRDEFARDPF
jgi:hypothetical protein